MDAQAKGSCGAKIKLGRPEAAQDTARLLNVRDAVGPALRRDTSQIVLPTVLGPREARPGHGKAFVVAAGAGDNAAAAVGLGIGSGDAVVSLGTSGTVFASVSAPVVDPSGAVACFADAAGGFLPIVTTLNAARILDTTAELLTVDHTGLAVLALNAPSGANGVVMLPFFEGERTPNLPDETATILGLTIQTTTRENLARAAFEGMVCALAEGVAALVDSGVLVERIILTGGAARSPATIAIAADVFEVPVVAPDADEYVALGASIQAAWAATGMDPAWHTPVPAPEPGSTEPSSLTAGVLRQYREAYTARYGNAKDT